jgi:hypothetical protein
MTDRLSYTVAEFMAASGYSRRKVYEAVARGELKTFLDGKRRYISEQAARAFISQLEAADHVGAPLGHARGLDHRHRFSF